MANDHKFTIITPYHFGKSRAQDYSRLLCSLRSSIREVGENGRVILVANGTDDGAEDPLQVMLDLGEPVSNKIVPVILRSNVKNTGGLNAGISMALEFPLERNECREWICSVQSSAILSTGWCAHVSTSSNNATVNVLHGRLVREDTPDVIWADGHYLKAGRTLNHNYEAQCATSKCAEYPTFPCLSASAYCSRLVRSIVNKYGNFVCENLAHYGDCTDVAIRIKSVDPSTKFEYCKQALACKRVPVRTDATRIDEMVSQLLAARYYYNNRETLAENRIKEKRKANFIEIMRVAHLRACSPYSPKENNAPAYPFALDCEWLF